MNQSPKIALLTASGVSETEMTAIQRALAGARKRGHVISPDSGLIHSWGEGTWGHCYPVDAKLETSLGVDYDMLILPGGTRAIAKLMANPHTKRFVNSFFMTQAPVVVFPDANTILATNSLSGDNAVVLSYEGAEGLAAAVEQMMFHLDNAAPAIAEAA